MRIPQLFFFFHDELTMIIFFLLLVLLLMLSAAATRSTSPATSSCNNLPPSPPKLPLIGHMHLVGANPHISLSNLAKNHSGDGGLMLLQLGQVRNLVVSSPIAAESILRTHDHVFASRPRSAIADELAHGSSDIAFAPLGDYWRKARRLVATNLLSPRKVQSLRRGRREEVAVVVAKLDAADGAAVDMRDLLGCFTNDVLCRAVCGENSFRRDGRNQLFMELAAGNAVQYAGFHLEDYFPSLAKVDLFRRFVSGDETRKLKERWDRVLGEIINEHEKKSLMNRDQLHMDDDQEHESDFVDILLANQQEYNLTRGNIHAILMDMFAAGTDTSYIALEFAMAELIKKPHLMTKLQDEIRKNTTEGSKMASEDNLNNMPYLKAVIKETLRLHPPVPLLLPRLSMAQCDINSYTVPADTRVIVNVWALGRDSRSWEKPEEFIPERFMDSVNTRNNVDFKGTDFQFIPFGAGRRICPGMNFGMATVELMLANLMYCFDWELPAGMDKDDVDTTGEFALTMGLKKRLYLIPRSHVVKLK